MKVLGHSCLVLLQMHRVGTLFVLVSILVSTFSLSLQTVYKNAFCQDTQEYLSVAGKSITICGKTCDFRYAGPQQSEPGFTFNFHASPLYFEPVANIPMHFFAAEGEQFDLKPSGYHFFHVPDHGHPPQFTA